MSDRFSSTQRQAESRQQTKKPDLHKVFLLNDDYTTMEFVVQVLESVFVKSHVEATSIMLHVHNHGKGLAGTYIRDVAEAKISAVHDLARQNGFPLRCEMEKE